MTAASDLLPDDKDALKAALIETRAKLCFIPAALLQHFQCVTWPIATAVAGRRQDAREVRIDAGARMRSM